jgi:hypothetical protein
MAEILNLEDPKLRRIFRDKMSVRRTLLGTMRFYYFGWIVGAIAMAAGIAELLAASGVEDTVIGSTITLLGGLVICVTLLATTVAVWSLRIIHELRRDHP